LETASADSQPYIQHQGGPKSFLNIVDQSTLTFPDVGRNARYISVGNLSVNNQAFIFLIDYTHRKRFKSWGTARCVEGHAAPLAGLVDPTCHATPARTIVFSIAAWNLNCTPHITPRFTTNGCIGAEWVE